MLRVVPSLLLVACLAACGPHEGRPSPNCGIAAMVAPSGLMNQFTVPRMTLSQPPASMPERLPARVAAGPAFSSVVGTTSTGDSLLVIGVEGQPPANFVLGFGVLVVAANGTPQGIMLFEGPPVEAAPELGTITFGAITAPLIGVEAAPTVYESPGCPAFPDSLRK